MDYSPETGFALLVPAPPLNFCHDGDDNAVQSPTRTVRRTTMFTSISLHQSNRLINDLDFIATLGVTAVGLAITALAFAFGFGAEFGQILAIAG
jgi:hypothetical protein